MVYIANTPDLLTIARDAESHKRNRYVHTDLLESVLDPEGNHVATILMVHEFVCGVKVEPHYRTMWMIKTKNSDEPKHVTLDVDISLFEKLTSNQETE